MQDSVKAFKFGRFPEEPSLPVSILPELTGLPNEMR